MRRGSAHWIVAFGVALTVAGCSAAAASSTGSAGSTSSTSHVGSTGGTSSAAGKGNNDRVPVPATAYLSVVQHYNLPDQASRGPGYELTYAVTDKQVIARLAAMINALPVASDQNIAVPCTSTMGPAYQLDFQDSKAAQPTAEVSILCFGVDVTVGSHQEPTLSMGPMGDTRFLGEVGALLGPSMPKNG